MTPLEIIAEIEAGAERATAGPYFTAIDTHHCLSVFADAEHCQPSQIGLNASEICKVAPPDNITEQDQQNAAFIASARSSVPLLCKALRAAVEKLTEIKGLHNVASIYAEDALTTIAEIMKETK